MTKTWLRVGLGEGVADGVALALAVEVVPFDWATGWQAAVTGSTASSAIAPIARPVPMSSMMAGVCEGCLNLS
jgi:hypothetical protein